MTVRCEHVFLKRPGFRYYGRKGRKPAVTLQRYVCRRCQCEDWREVEA